MAREFPDIPFARYADDVVAHCRTKAQAVALVGAVTDRLALLGLELHPDKTKVVYCKDGKRWRKAEHVSNPQVAGWINYYGAFYRSRLDRLGRRIDAHLINWAMRKYRRLRGHPERAKDWLDEVKKRQPRLFAHWTISQARPGT